MPLVRCEAKPGLRDSEAAVAVRDVKGRIQRLRVEWDFLEDREGQYYLPVGIVAASPRAGDDSLLIELPHEADSVANRLWVEKTTVVRPTANHHS